MPQIDRKVWANQVGRIGYREALIDTLTPDALAVPEEVESYIDDDTRRRIDALSVVQYGLHRIAFC